MNSLEKVNQNSNYDTYLNRMDGSYLKSSKCLIPLFCKGKEVLDVGCASGTLIKPLMEHGFSVTGIDLNQSAVDICKAEGYNVINSSLRDLKGTFDTIVFSSVLHEFSSYNEDEKYRYTLIPIIMALADAYHHLNSHGRIIIRDGIKETDARMGVKTTSPEVTEAFKKYLNDAPMYKGTKALIAGQSIIAPRSVIKEFAYTYTWGKESYSREVNEQYGILTVEEWKQVVKTVPFYTITNFMTSADDYIKYVSKFFVLDKRLVQMFEQSTILISAERED